MKSIQSTTVSGESRTMIMFYWNLIVLKTLQKEIPLGLQDVPISQSYDIFSCLAPPICEGCRYIPQVFSQNLSDCDKAPWCETSVSSHICEWCSRCLQEPTLSWAIANMINHYDKGLDNDLLQVREVSEVEAVTCPSNDGLWHRNQQACMYPSGTFSDAEVSQLHGCGPDVLSRKFMEAI